MISREKPKLVYQVNNAHSVIFENGSFESDLRVYDAGNVQIDQNIYAFEISIWNRGNKQLLYSDMAIPLNLTLSDSVRILSTRITAETLKQATNFTVEPVAGETNKIEIKWENLIPNHGVNVQVIYADDSESSVTLDGVTNNGDTVSIAYLYFSPAGEVLNFIFLLIVVFLPIIIVFWIMSRIYLVAAGKIARVFPDKKNESFIYLSTGILFLGLFFQVFLQKDIVLFPISSLVWPLLGLR